MEINTIIIGASAAGLAVAACLQKENIQPLLHSDVRYGYWGNDYGEMLNI